MSETNGVSLDGLCILKAEFLPSIHSFRCSERPRDMAITWAPDFSRECLL